MKILFVIVILNFNYISFSQDLSNLIDSMKIDKEKIYILIDKSDYKLYIMIDSGIIKEYPCVFGKNPVDAKIMEGDNCTPEGIFKIIDFYHHEKWNKFIWINYPNKESYKNFDKAIENNIIPKNSKIGGEVGIHGLPENKINAVDNKNNYSHGCISMKNEDIDEIYPFIYIEMKVIIRK